MPSSSNGSDVKLPGFGIPLNHGANKHGAGGRFPHPLMTSGYKWVLRAWVSLVVREMSLINVESLYDVLASSR